MKVECEGCYDCHNEAKSVTVFSGTSGNDTIDQQGGWVFNYCQEAIDGDERQGFIVVVNKESQNER